MTIANPTTPPHPGVNIPSERLWKQKRLAAIAAIPVMHIKSANLRPQFCPRGYVVTLEGEKLHQAIIPPLVTVGGMTVKDIHVTANGDRITGYLTSWPIDKKVVVDYFFTRAEYKLEQNISWWLWIRPFLFCLWRGLDRFVRKVLGYLP